MKSKNEDKGKEKPITKEEKPKEESSKTDEKGGGIITQKVGVEILKETMSLGEVIEKSELDLNDYRTEEPEPIEEPTKLEPLFDDEFMEKYSEQKPIEEPGKIKDTKPKSLIEEMNEIKGQLKTLTEDIPEGKEKHKNFKMPLNVKRHTKNLKKMMDKDKVQVLMLKLTGAIKPTIGEINAGRLIVGDRYWNAADDIIWGWMNKTPTAIICDWDMQPLTRSRLMEDTNVLGSHLHPQTIAIRAMVAKMAEDKESKKGMKPMALLVMAVVGIVGYYMFFGGG